MTVVKCPSDESPPSDEFSGEMDERDLQEDEEERQVMSEVHFGCPPAYSGPYVSRLTVSLPPGVDVKRCECLFEQEEENEVSEQQGISVDRDGDLVLARHRDVLQSSFSVTIRHSITSSIPNVGFQIWKAELLLADFLLHKMFTSSAFNGIIALELGAGTGGFFFLIGHAESSLAMLSAPPSDDICMESKSCLKALLIKVVVPEANITRGLLSLSLPGLAGLLLAYVAKTMFLTDSGDGILDNCKENVKRNARVLKYQGSVYVRELDWFTSWPPARSHQSSGQNRRHSWTSAEVDEAQAASVLLAADVIYSENLTDALFSTVQGLMSLGSEKILYLALEKRYNFSLSDLNIVANGYSHFRGFLREKEYGGDPFHSGCGSSPAFVGECLDLSQIPQYMEEYDRGNDLELWQIRYRRS